MVLLTQFDHEVKMSGSPRDKKSSPYSVGFSFAWYKNVLEWSYLLFFWEYAHGD